MSMTLEEAWRGHSRLAWWWAARLARIYRKRPSDFIGWLCLRMAHLAPLHDPARGRFSVLFSLHMVRDAAREVVKADSDRAALAHYNRTHRTPAQVKLGASSFDANRHVVPSHVGSDSWTMDVIGCFGSTENLWRFLCRGLSDDRRVVLQLRYRDGLKLAEIGARMGFSKERARQVLGRAVDDVAGRVARVQEWRALFKGGGA